MLTKADLKSVARLTRKKYWAEANQFIAEGGRLCEEAINSGWQIDRIIYCPVALEYPRARQALRLAQRRGFPVAEVSAKDFAGFSDTQHTQGILAVVHKRPPQMDPLERARQTPRCLWVGIEELQDPGNLGTILRAADWMGVDGVLIGKNCVKVYNPKVVRASMGSIFRLAIYEVDNLIEILTKFQMFGTVIYGADQSGDFPYTTLRYAPKKILMLGHETHGFSDEIKALIRYHVAIPKRGGGESLNVAIAASILLAEMCR